MKFIGEVGYIRSQRELLDLSDSELECTPEGRDRLRLFADFNLRETEMVVQTADWTLAADADVITNEQYADAEVIRKIFVERLDLDPSAFTHTIYDFLDDEGVTEETLGAFYVKIRRSWYLYDSETRKSSLGNIDCCNNEGKVSLRCLISYISFVRFPVAFANSNCFLFLHTLLIVC